MADIKLRHPTVSANIPQCYKIETLVLAICCEVGETLAEGIIGCPIQALRETLPKLNLKAIIAVPAGVIHKANATVGSSSANAVGIEQEEVDRIRPRRIGSGEDACAGTESVAEHTANIVLVNGKHGGQGAYLAILQIGDEAGGLIPGIGRDCRQCAARTEGCVKDWRRHLPRPSQVLETGYTSRLV